MNVLLQDLARFSGSGWVDLEPFGDPHSVTLWILVLADRSESGIAMRPTFSAVWK
ncbi:MAG: hypothetical protein KY444_08165 [Gemmatimonadetes bacterium]|nr:hypothetical protein [Gemmatimonadota bacterium]